MRTVLESGSVSHVRTHCVLFWGCTIATENVIVFVCCNGGPEAVQCVTVGWLTTVYCLYGGTEEEGVLVPMGLCVLVMFTHVLPPPSP